MIDATIGSSGTDQRPPKEPFDPSQSILGHAQAASWLRQPAIVSWATDYSPSSFGSGAQASLAFGGTVKALG